MAAVDLVQVVQTTQTQIVAATGVGQVVVQQNPTYNVIQVGIMVPVASGDADPVHRALLDNVTPGQADSSALLQTSITTHKALQLEANASYNLLANGVNFHAQGIFDGNQSILKAAGILPLGTALFGMLADGPGSIGSVYLGYEQEQVVRNVYVDGNSYTFAANGTNVTGFSGTPGGGNTDATNARMAWDNCAAQFCFIGFDYRAVQYNTHKRCSAIQCGFGHLIRNDWVNGGATDMHFITPHAVYCNVGYVYSNESATQNYSLPMNNITMDNPIANQNTVCAHAFVAINPKKAAQLSVRLRGGSTEYTAPQSSPLSTNYVYTSPATVKPTWALNPGDPGYNANDLTNYPIPTWPVITIPIKRSVFYVQSGDIYLQNIQVNDANLGGWNVDPIILLDGPFANVYMDNVTGYGNPFGMFIQSLNQDAKAFYNGPANHVGGAINVYKWPDGWEVFYPDNSYNQFSGAWWAGIPTGWQDGSFPSQLNTAVSSITPPFTGINGVTTGLGTITLSGNVGLPCTILNLPATTLGSSLIGGATAVNANTPYLRGNTVGYWPEGGNFKPNLCVSFVVENQTNTAFNLGFNVGGSAAGGNGADRIVTLWPHRPVRITFAAPGSNGVDQQLVLFPSTQNQAATIAVTRLAFWFGANKDRYIMDQMIKYGMWRSQ